MQENLTNELSATLDAMRATGLQGYDEERADDIAKFIALYQSGKCDELCLSAVVEASAKTGISLTDSERVRELLIDMLTVVVEHSGGRQFFGPPTPPRREMDSHLVSISSRYVAPRSGVNVVIDDGSRRLLLVQRADKGQWCLPGGYADVGLAPAEVAIKEAREETGLDVEIVSLIGVWDVMQCGGQRIPQYTSTFLARPVGGELRHHPHESLDVRWFGLDEIPRDNLWERGEPWLGFAVAAITGTLETPYFDAPRPGFD